MIKKTIKYTLLIGFIGFVGIQFKTIDRSNPKPRVTQGVTPEVDAILRRCCYDCHSNEVVWPWYSYIAPVSWRIEKHVVDGRRHLNFSTLHTLPIERQIHKLDEVVMEVSGGSMPLEDYLRIHEDAEVTDAEADILNAWCEKRMEELEEKR